MRARDRGQAEHVYVWRFEPADHVAGVEPAHAVRDDVDALAAGLGFDVAAQFGGALFDGGGGRDRGEDYGDVVGLEGFGDAAPVVDAWEELADEVELVEAEEAVGEDDGVEGGSWSGLDGGFLFCGEGATVGMMVRETHGIWRGFGHSHPLLWGPDLKFEDREIAGGERIR